MEDQSKKANEDVVPANPRRRFSLPQIGRRGAIVLASIGALLVLAVAGAAYAGYDYGRDHEGQIYPGSSIAGVEIDGMTRQEALAAVQSAIEPQLNRPITVAWRDRSWEVTPKELGARNDAEAAVNAALQASSEASLFQKIRMSVFGHDFGFDREVAITYPQQGVRGYVKGLASSLDRDPRDASIDSSSGWLKVKKEQEGRTVVALKSRRSLSRALHEQGSFVSLTVKTVAPEVTTRDFDKILLLRIGENKLYLYDDGKIVDSWDVATGQPEYPTPTGAYEIVEKRYMPTWINPDPEGWGADMPLSIAPGPGNPLGTRALNWSAEGIRFHGTSADYSIGYNASHGCVRMHMWDVEELYDMVEVGTPIVSVLASELKPMYVAAPDPTPVEDDEKEQGKVPEKATDSNADEPQGKKKKNG